MKAIVLEQPGRFTMVSREEPGEPGAGEALVKVHRVGVCGTDFHAFRGEQPFFTYPRVLGHELGVEIVAVGENRHGLVPGQLCAVEPYLNCHHCSACRRGNTNCCQNLSVLGVHKDGGMTDYLTVPVDKLHPSDLLSIDQLALVEMLGIGAHAVDRAQLRQGETVLVVGAGPIGMAVIQFARLAGARVLVMEMNEQRLAFCRAHFGVEQTIDGRVEPQTQLDELLSGERPTAVFDATGNPNSMMASFNYVAHAGRLIFVGFFQGNVSFHSPDFHRREVTLLASRNATGAELRRVIRALEAGQVDPLPMITHRVACDRMIEAFPSWLEPGSGVIKAMIEF